jgi:adenylate cyclase
MAIEIERKFLVTGKPWLAARYPVKHIVQAYLSDDKARTVRIRIADTEAFITVKGETRGASRLEFEYPIPLADAEQLLQLCNGPIIDKHRYLIDVAGFTWEVDEFHRDNAGLVVAEIELPDETSDFPKPAWLGEEVTHDPRYYNSNLARCAFTSW